MMCLKRLTNGQPELSRLIPTIDKQWRRWKGSLGKEGTQNPLRAIATATRRGRRKKKKTLTLWTSTECQPENELTS